MQEGSHRWTTYRVVTEQPAAEVKPGQEAERPTRTRADRRPAILALLAEHGELSRAEIAAQIGLTDWSINRWLGMLVKSGQIELTTASKSSPLARYRLRSGLATSDSVNPASE
jgi:hypothetical protein